MEGAGRALGQYQWLLLLSFLASHALLVIYIFVRARMTLRRLHETASSAGTIASQFDRILPMARWATILFTAVHLYLPEGLQAVTAVLLRHSHILQYVPFIAECCYAAGGDYGVAVFLDGAVFCG